MNMRREMTMEEALAAYQRRGEEASRRNQSKTVGWIILYNDEKAHVVRDVKPREYVDVLYNIPIYSWHKKKSARLLYCYDNGHVNVMCPPVLLNGKLRNTRLKQRGYKRNGCNLMRVFVCDKDDYIVICSRDSKGCSYIKAQSLSTRTTHEMMDASGNFFVKDGSPYKWMIVPKELKEWLRTIILNNSSIGYPITVYTRYADLMAFEKCIAELFPPAIVSVQVSAACKTSGGGSFALEEISREC